MPPSVVFRIVRVATQASPLSANSLARHTRGKNIGHESRYVGISYPMSVAFVTRCVNGFVDERNDS